MTVSSEVKRSDFAGNGSTTAFATGFRFLQNSDIKVILTVTSTGVETVQIEVTNYTLVGAGLDAGGTVTMLVAPATGETLTIKRDVPLTQSTDYVENDPFPAESHEDALDKLTMIVQQQQEELDRSVKLSESSQSTDVTIPDPNEGDLIRWDDQGNLENVSIVNLDAAIITPFGRDLIDSPDAAAGRQVMELNALNPATLAVWQADTSALSGDVVTTKERISGNGGGAKGNVVSSLTVTVNGFDIVGHGTLALAWVLPVDKTIELKEIGALVDNVTDDTAAINHSFDLMKAVGGTITFIGFIGHDSELIFDTSADAKTVTFQGGGERDSGFRYNGPSNQASQAVRVGTFGVGSSGFVRFLHMGIYGQGQTIDGLHIFKGQRWQELDRFIVRSFDGMGITAGSGDVFLNTWGDVKILNCHRAYNLGNEFNANNISNIIIENCGTATTNTRHDETVPIGVVDGIGTNINVLSMETCPPDLGLQIKGKVIVGAMYQENNHGRNAGVGARPLIMSGVGPEVLSGNIKLSGFNANETGFFIFDLDDSDKAKIRINVNLPLPNPNSYQKPIEFGTSKRADLDINWQQFDGIGNPSRAEGLSFITSASNYKINGVDFIFGMPKEMVGRLLMTEYCVNKRKGRANQLSSTNRPVFTETNISAASRNGQEFQLSKNRFTAKYSQAAGGAFSIKSDFTLSNTKRFLFTTFNARRSVSDPLPRMRVLSGAQDFFINPTDTSFIGWTQISLVQIMVNADVNPVTFFPFDCADAVGSIYHGLSFIVDLSQFETDFGVSFDGMTTIEIADLIRPDYISDEWQLRFRGATPNFGTFDRGDKIYTYPPAASGKIGWVATLDIADASVDNSAFKTWGAIDA